MAVPTGAILQKETIKLIAEQIGISDLPDDVALQAVSDVEYRMRELTQVCDLWSMNNIAICDRAKYFADPFCACVKPLGGA
jgi:hypothetical protein